MYEFPKAPDTTYIDFLIWLCVDELEENKRLGRLAIKTWNTRDHVAEEKFIRQYFDFEHIARVGARINEHEIDVKTSKREDVIKLMLAVMANHLELFPQYEYKIDDFWQVAQDDRVIINSLFQNYYPYKFKDPIPITWHFQIVNGKFRRHGVFGTHHIVAHKLMELSNLSDRQVEIDRYITYLEVEGIIEYVE